MSTTHKCISSHFASAGRSPGLFSRARGCCSRDRLRPRSARPVGIIFIDSVCALLSLREMSGTSEPGTMASVSTAPLRDAGCGTKGLRRAALPIIFQFKRRLAAELSRLIYAAALVRGEAALRGDR